ncbi:MAG: dihydrolipoyl dehydrogenase [Nitrosospira sp.]|nr:dihydrolipoyl dehydrogenase [Nitrosospira sp.]
MPQSFDVAVIGAGPGGYVAAIRCAQLGLNTVCIDEWKSPQGKPSLGGTCLNVGCIPSKALLESSENFERAAHKFASHGIRVEGLSIDIPTMMSRKDKIVTGFTGGVAMLLKKNKVASMHGHGILLKGSKDESGNHNLWQIEVKNGDKTDTIEAKHIIIATGSTPRPLPFAQVDNERILDNTGALAMTEAPKRLGVIGGGVIGLEMGSMWRRLGSEVSILEALPGFLTAADEQVAKEAKKIFTRESGLVIHTGIRISGIKTGEKSITIEYANAGDADGNVQKLDVDKLIIAVGRTPHTHGLGAENIGLKLDDRGYIEVDSECRTNLSNIFAVGDVVRGPMLAHKASEEGVAVAETIAGQPGHVNLDTIPWVIYTSPEIAWVGKTEQQLKTDGVQYKAGQFPFMANGRARALGETGGFVKVLADAHTDRILGIHIIGPYASELIAEAVMAMEFAASSEDIARIVHAHPSLSEVLHEAALGVDKRAIHI